VDAAEFVVDDESVLDDLEPKSFPIADVAAFVAADAADLARASVSRLAIEPRAPSTELELLSVTRLLEPEISPLKKSAGVVDVVDLEVSPFTFVTRLTMLVRLLVLERSSLPVDLY